MKPITSRVLSIVLFTASVAVPNSVAQYPVAWEQPGKIGPESTNRNGIAFDVASPPVPLKDREPFKTVANQVFAILLRMPTLAQPRGFDVLTFGSAESIDAEGDTRSSRPHHINGYMRIRIPVYLNTGGRIIQSQEAFAAEITVVSNDLVRLAGLDKSVQSIEDGQGKMYFPAPHPSGSSPHGAQWGNWTVMTHRGAPVFKPVTQERVLNAIIETAQHTLEGFEKGIKENQATLEQVHKSNPEMWNKMHETLEKMQKGFEDQAAPYRKFITDTRSRMAAMPSAERQAPARVKTNTQPCCGPLLLAAAGEAGAQDLVAVNPDFFDASLPATAPQILAVMISQQVKGWPGGALDRKISEELDWRALEALLK